MILNPGESILYKSKKHLVYGFPWFYVFAIVVFMILIPSGYIYFNNLDLGAFKVLAYEIDLKNVYWWGVIISLVYSTLLFLYSYYLWLHNILIVTNQRCIIMIKNSLLHEDINSLPLDKITGVSVHKKGIIDIFFKCGDIVIETASDAQDIKFMRVSHPKSLQNMIEQQLVKMSKTERVAEEKKEMIEKEVISK